MTFSTAINVIASGLLAAAISGFWILLYREDSAVRRWPAVGSIALRLPLIAVAAGSLYNCLSSKEADWSEAVLNTGLAGIFVWGFQFHNKLIKNGHGSNSKRYESRGLGGH